VAHAEDMPAAIDRITPPAKAKVATAKPEPAGEQPKALDREALKREIASFGLVAIVEASLRDDKPSARADWAPNPPRPTGAPAARSAMWAASIDDAIGAGGLKLTSTGDDGPAAAIPLDRIASIGHGDGLDDVSAFDGGRAHVSGEHTPRAPMPRDASLARSGIPPETIQRVVHQSFGRLRVCYESALRHDPTLAGRIAVKFTIDPTGAVAVASDAGSDLHDTSVVSCVVRGFAGLTFPQFNSGVVTVIYPLAFTPGD
jgi:hypothetical protein